MEKKCYKIKAWDTKHFLSGALGGSELTVNIFLNNISPRKCFKSLFCKVITNRSSNNFFFVPLAHPELKWKWFSGTMWVAWVCFCSTVMIKPFWPIRLIENVTLGLGSSNESKWRIRQIKFHSGSVWWLREWRSLFSTSLTRIITEGSWSRECDSEILNSLSSRTRGSVFWEPRREGTEIKSDDVEKQEREWRLFTPLLSQIIIHGIQFILRRFWDFNTSVYHVNLSSFASEKTFGVCLKSFSAHSLNLLEESWKNLFLHKNPCQRLLKPH